MHCSCGNIGSKFATETGERKGDSDQISDHSLNVDTTSIVVVLVGPGPVVQGGYENVSFG